MHESGHIQEKTIGHAYEISEILEIKSPEYQIPESLREDAELIYLQQETGAYIPPRVGKPYQKQFNEVVPFQIGSAAKNQSARQLRKEKTTHPALL